MKQQFSHRDRFFAVFTVHQCGIAEDGINNKNIKPVKQNGTQNTTPCGRSVRQCFYLRVTERN